MRKRIFTLTLFAALLLPAAGWGASSNIDPDGAWVLAASPEGHSVTLDARSDKNSSIESAATAPPVGTPIVEVSGRSLFQQLLSWLESRLLGF